MGIKYSDLPFGERPANKLKAHGAASLSNSELFALVTGIKEPAKIAEIFSHLESGLSDFKFKATPELQEFGLSKTEAAKIIAVVEFAKRVGDVELGKRLYKISAARDVYTYLKNDFEGLTQEIAIALLLNVKNEVIGKVEFSKGGICSSIVEPRILYKEAIKAGAAAIIMAHNHPSGDLSHSDSDLIMTSKCYKAGKLVDIELHDHLIFGRDGYSSLRDKHSECFRENHSLNNNYVREHQDKELEEETGEEYFDNYCDEDGFEFDDDYEMEGEC